LNAIRAAGIFYCTKSSLRDFVTGIIFLPKHEGTKIPAWTVVYPNGGCCDVQSGGDQKLRDGFGAPLKEQHRPASGPGREFHFGIDKNWLAHRCAKLNMDCGSIGV
jgi:hypothetical protein